jgi:hypothetical protein
MYKRSASVTVTTLAAAAEETYTITETGNTLANVGDVVVVNPPVGGAEASWGVIKAWVESRGVIKFTASNFHASAALDGGAVIVRYAVIR